MLCAQCVFNLRTWGLTAPLEDACAGVEREYGAVAEELELDIADLLLIFLPDVSDNAITSCFKHKGIPELEDMEAEPVGAAGGAWISQPEVTETSTSQPISSLHQAAVRQLLPLSSFSL